LPPEKLDALFEADEENRRIRLWQNFTRAATEEEQQQAVRDYLNTSYGENHFGQVALGLGSFSSNRYDQVGFVVRPEGVSDGPKVIAYCASLSAAMMPVVQEIERLTARARNAPFGSSEAIANISRATRLNYFLITGTPFIWKGQLYNADAPISSSETPQIPMP
jgi:hypothetical protein